MTHEDLGGQRIHGPKNDDWMIKLAEVEVGDHFLLEMVTGTDQPFGLPYLRSSACHPVGRHVAAISNTVPPLEGVCPPSIRACDKTCICRSG